MSETLLQLNNVESAYGPVRAIRGVSLRVQRGQIATVLGSNGAGKTTTVRLLNGVLEPTTGSARVFGFDVATQSDDVRKYIGVVFQSPSLDGKLSVEENMFHQGHLYGLQGNHLHQRTSELLSRLGLSERKNDYVEKLSGGLQRRVEIAKSLLHQPKLLLLDEPSTGLDPGARIAVWELLLELRERDKITILLTTHLLEEAEKCDKLVIVDKGEIVANGSPTELKLEIGNDIISIGARNIEVLLKKIIEKFGTIASLFDSSIRIERENGHEFIPQLVSSFPNEISSITLSKPTLEDVFIHKTGRKFS